MVFYQDPPDLLRLRFGDIVKGFTLIQPKLENNLSSEKVNLCSINFNNNSFCAVLSPCCSISGNDILLTPLLPLDYYFVQVPYIKEDFTRVNREMLAEQSMKPIQWDNLSAEDKVERIAEGLTYAHLDNFVYAPNPSLPEYSIGKKNPEVVRHYMIDFKKTFSLNCDAEFNPKKNAFENKFKLLELSVETRYELREKLSAYYGRIPKEDKPLLEEKGIIYD